MTPKIGYDDPLFSRGGISMESVSPEVQATSRKNYSAILRAITDAGQVNVADQLVVHEATISRMKQPGGDIERVALILAGAGICLNSQTQVTVEREVFESLKVLARANLDTVDATKV
ncbi:hypothetical protein ACO0K3_03810 [Undibacterium sp. Rencai35W]|uniref:hypothetical protein n=1 Tax=Undibacterium sp. Rencai35W TaxID=3413046 RepID=UPI003BF025D0